MEPKLVKQITEVAEDDALKQVDVIIGLLSIIKLREQMLPLKNLVSCIAL